MARISRQVPIVADLDPAEQERIDALLRLLGDAGLRVRKHEVRPILKKSMGEERPMLFVQIVARWRANAFGGAGSPGFYGDRPRWQLTTYLEHVPAIVRALERFIAKGDLFDLCCELKARSKHFLSIERRLNGSGLLLWFPRSDIAELFVGFRRDDIAEAIFVLLSYDDPARGVEAVRRLR